MTDLQNKIEIVHYLKMHGINASTDKNSAIIESFGTTRNGAIYSERLVINSMYDAKRYLARLAELSQP